VIAASVVEHEPVRVVILGALRAHAAGRHYC
jgi:hypothetical protein